MKVSWYNPVVSREFSLLAFSGREFPAIFTANRYEELVDALTAYIDGLR